MKVAWANARVEVGWPPLSWNTEPLAPLCLGRLQLMCELGNVVINQIYEARVEAMAVKKPGPSCSR